MGPDLGTLLWRCPAERANGLRSPGEKSRPLLSLCPAQGSLLVSDGLACTPV